jgi:hypothetical protein
MVQIESQGQGGLYSIAESDTIWVYFGAVASLTPRHHDLLSEKARANLSAIRALKRIEAEDRPATPEEKKFLVKHKGWGVMPGAFEAQFSREWKATSPEVIRAIWQAMERFGFEAGGHILEPSTGVGHFFGMMPEDPVLIMASIH